eukprot:1971485-Pyramimonas_sp.AAC.1
MGGVEGILGAQWGTRVGLGISVRNGGQQFVALSLRAAPSHPRARRPRAQPRSNGESQRAKRERREAREAFACKFEAAR